MRPLRYVLRKLSTERPATQEQQVAEVMAWLRARELSKLLQRV